MYNATCTNSYKGDSVQPLRSSRCDTPFRWRHDTAVDKARMCERVPFERVFCSPSVPKSMAFGMTLHVGNIDTNKCNMCE